MPKRSKKSKSKRLSLKQKYKVIKKVKEHHKKKRRELKKSGKKPKEHKDPGIPSQWPFKEELLKEMAWKRQQILMAEKQKKEERKRAREDRAAMDVENDEANGMEALQASAAHKQADFEARKRAKITSDGSSKQGDADNSRRAFYKEFRKVVEASDVVIQVLDARDPAGCRCPDVERYVRSLDPNKRIILLLNKMDLVPREVGEAWLKHYRQELPAVAFKASTQQQADGLSRHKSSKGKGGSSAAQQQQSFAAGSGCLGGDTLLQLLKNYARNTAGGKGSITVGVVGLPNVGKSSVINSLKRARVAQVGATPGMTKGLQEIHLDKHIRLLDSPGIVFASGDGAAAAALRNAIKVERLEDPIAPVSEILSRVPAKQLMSLYKVAAFEGVDAFLQQVASARGKLKRGGIVYVEAAARIVLQDWNEGRIPYFTTPPTERPNQEFESAEIVSGWAAEFDADKVFAAEASAVIQHLPSLQDEGAAFFEAASGGNVALDMEGMEEEEAGAGAAGADDMDDSDQEPVDAAAGSSGRQSAGQNAGLYNEIGQHNPKKAKAEAKRLKRAAKAAAAAGPGDDDDGPGSDFDFDDANAADGLVGSEGGESEEGGSEEGMSGSDVGSDDDSEAEGDGGAGESSEEYGAGDDSEDVDAKYIENMES